MSERLPLHDAHERLGARFTEAAGTLVPKDYGDADAEHEAVRSTAGIFDVSHMGEIETRGPQAEEFLQHLLSNDVRRVPEGGAQYSVMCLADGGIVEYVRSIYRGDRYKLVTELNRRPTRSRTTR